MDFGSDTKCNTHTPNDMILSALLSYHILFKPSMDGFATEPRHFSQFFKEKHLGSGFSLVSLQFLDFSSLDL